MRLVCPNCGAQYEVPDDVIPETGRDVQCSNCGNTWFQVHADQDTGLSDDLGEPAPDVEDADASVADAETVSEISGAPEQDAAPDDPWVEPDEGLADDQAEDEGPLWDDGQGTPQWDDPGPGVTAGQMPAPPIEDYEDDYEAWDDTPAASTPEQSLRRALDPDVADLLREEAEREARQRAAERTPLESQPDLGLAQSGEDEIARRQREAQERMARLRGARMPGADTSKAESAAAGSATAAASRRDLLPDIDEINSTLRSTNERRPSAADDHDQPGAAADTQTDEQRRSSGFRRGFLMMILLMVLAIVLYVYAPRLAEMAPPMEPVLSSYVEAMNDLRFWIDAQLRGVLRWLDSVSQQSTEG
ncbi:zinc-ribbon domain-containing protein [Lutimaribacter sp. EGI FJ00015]|uniref:Zinc-ribbon domain-containing protein n=1 Tax=Lutimaribacter degradans TaxID=2945989 RepID=A0ACC5ZZE7_9RHOB|nr:zinc-ribbon domain-containing protein [Lutimaribacter sp. EGI FJ00013]MCM2563461.1 zinc-ribbon domain-containing protein [Lutimaribacter sp. EGI FJ00013]MCO0614641.1 zinc-ribbon domain-containing protein [Lutimaribacter sp. EGI FJ00015]MCO0637312.1 zinc-ribbon domain-containing protein [Lutimaribacter sp. EGI FJ00014]